MGTKFMSEYLRVIELNGSATPKAIRPLDDISALTQLRGLKDVTPFDELDAYFSAIDGYDQYVCDELDLFEPTLAWDLSVLSLEQAVSHYNETAPLGSENPDYWPYGFLPVLWDLSGSYLLVNCVKSSPFYGGVYDMTEGVGCNRVSSSLSEFFAASAKEVEAGLRRYDKGESTLCVEWEDYLKLAAPIFSHAPFFVRTRMDAQIVDWK